MASLRALVAAVVSPGLVVACGGATAPIEAGAPPGSIALCVSCHGKDGRAVIEGYPHIGGQDATYLRKQLEAYRAGTRGHDAMTAVVGAVPGEDIAALAAWYAAQDPCPPLE